MNAPEKIKLVDPERLIAEIVAANNGDRDASVKQAMDAIRADGAMYNAVLDPLLEFAVKQKVDLAMREKRRAIDESIFGDRKYFSPAVRDHAMQVIIESRSVFDWPMPGNKSLGECTRADLLSCAEKYEGAAQTILKRCQWYRLLCAELKSDSAKVRSLKEDVVIELRKKAEFE